MTNNHLTVPVRYNSLLDLFDDFFESPVKITSTENFPKLNIKKQSKDGKNSYTIEAALAGYSRDEISVKIDRNVLELSCNKKEEKEAGSEETYFVREISSRKFSRRIALGDNFDLENPIVSYENGILSITFHEDSKKAPKILQIP